MPILWSSELEDLRLVVKDDLTAISGALRSVSLITSDNDSEIRNPMRQEAERAAKPLVELVQTRVLENPQLNYATFVTQFSEATSASTVRVCPK